MNTIPCAIDPEDVQITAIRAQGPGGQNVNKVANAAHLRFDIRQSSLPVEIQQRLMALRDHHVGRDGVIVIKAQKFRSLPKNREDALRRLNALVSRAAVVPKRRRATRPTKASIERRLQEKSRRSSLKSKRGGGRVSSLD
jgi:ribosome-associated protein